MKKEDYIETLSVKGKRVDVGLDDCGQCYYFEFKDNNGDTWVKSCGSFNGDYVGEIADYFNVDEKDIYVISPAKGTKRKCRLGQTG